MNDRPNIFLTELTGIKAVAPSDQEAGLYAVYADNRLFLCNVGSLTAAEAATLPNIQTIAHDIGDGRMEGMEHEISIHYHHPYVCVTERFGTNAALINLLTRAARELSREDYHCDVSSYSFGFLERDRRTLCICQTQWNRLDIFDAETGENLTEREIYYRDSGNKKEDGNPIYEKKNYLDYFHSQLHVAPDGKHFLSNGWVWQPFDQIRIFETDKFFRTFELESVAADYGSGYNWDRPCAFIDNDLFVTAVDDLRKTGDLEPEDKQTYEYKQLAFFKVSGDYYKENAYGFRWLSPSKLVPCTAFSTNGYGEVKGRLYYDKTGAHLVALTPNGAFTVNLTGDILAHLPEVIFRDIQSHGDMGSQYSQQIGWDYSPEHRVFYTWRDGVGIVERRFGEP